MKKIVTTDEAIQRWNLHAETFTANYTEKGDMHREVLLNPTFLSLLQDVKGKKILDAGCGEGYFSRILAGMGATLTSVDYSESMLQLAKVKTNHDAITYLHGNCENLPFLNDNQFDVIVSNMVIQDLENYEAAFNEMYRCLKKDGMFIFSILHPCFITPSCMWNTDKQFWMVKRYFDEGVYDQTIPREADEKLLFYHRTLTSYFKAIQRAGFMLEDLIEPMPSNEMLAKYPHFNKDLDKANFIVFKLRK